MDIWNGNPALSLRSYMMLGRSLKFPNLHFLCCKIEIEKFYPFHFTNYCEKNVTGYVYGHVSQEIPFWLFLGG